MNTIKVSRNRNFRSVPFRKYTPPMSATGGLAHEATYFINVRLASLHVNCLVSGGMSIHAIVMGWLRCSLSFSLLRSAIQCARGARSSIRHYIKAPPHGFSEDGVQHVLGR